MTKYRSYPKIFSLYKQEVDGILNTKSVVQIKIDGANAVIYQNDGQIRCGTRTRELPLEESFRGFQEYVRANFNLAMYFSRNPYHILYGEWLVPHSIRYDPTFYNHFYLFDIYDTQTGLYLPQEDVESEAEFLGLKYPPMLGTFDNLTKDKLDEFLKESWGGQKYEGVVIKPIDFVNEFGDRPYGKYVSQAFKEKNAIVFGGNDKHSEFYWEQYITNKYCSLATLKKIMGKLSPEINERLDKKHTPRVASSCVHDSITENAYEIFKKVPKVDNKKLNSLMTKKYVVMYHNFLEGMVSIADEVKDGEI